MSNITTFPFDRIHFDKMKSYNYGLNWPVVYLIENGVELYVGQTSNVYGRSNQHYKNPERRKLKNIHIVTDEEYNKSATLDIESSLIQYLSADGKYIIQNANNGLQNGNYYDRQKYQAKFEVIWEDLKKMSIAQKELVQIKNSDLFKYSPYKSLTADQQTIADEIIDDIYPGAKKTIIIHGGPGTGKTILATYLFKRISEINKTIDMKVALVVPMTSLRKTLKKVFKNIKGLSPSMVIGPNEVSKKYDILIVDEAHRLKQRRNITNYKSFDDTNKLLGLEKNGTELDWILNCSDTQILFYDEGQSIRPSDIDASRFAELEVKQFQLNSQLRISAGDDGDKYINFVNNVFDLSNIDKISFDDYDFMIYDDIRKMVSDIKSLNDKHDLCRMVSGYAWPWISLHDPNKHDIEIDGMKLRWNSINHNWVYSPNAINEVGCIHTVQGYDLNFAGVIIGPELTFDKVHKKFVVHPDKYMDANGKRGVDDVKELERYIINIYKTLFTRGIKGTYVYIVDTSLREYFKEAINNSR